MDITAAETPEERLARLLMAQGQGAPQDWQRGVNAANGFGLPLTASPQDKSVAPLMAAMARAGTTLQNNAPLLAETAPGRLAQGLARVATGGTPYAGPGLRREDYTDDPEARQPVEPMLHDAMNVADVMSLGGMPLAKEGALGIFGGRMAVTADKQALQRAEGLAQAGAPHDQILRDTGWFQGPDKKWRFEIDDSKAAMTPDGGKRLGDVLQHPELFQAYPELANVKAAPLAASSSAAAAYTPSGFLRSEKIEYPRSGDQLSGMLHEVQHAIQQREGFPTGSSRAAELPMTFGLPFRDKANVTRDFEAAGDRYWRNAGEVEARNVEARQLMDGPGRRYLAPSETMDVPMAEQSLKTLSNGWPDKLLSGVQIGGSAIGAIGSAAMMADAIAELKAKRLAEALKKSPKD